MIDTTHTLSESSSGFCNVGSIVTKILRYVFSVESEMDETSFVDVPKVDEPKVDVPKVDVPKVDGRLDTPDEVVPVP